MSKDVVETVLEILGRSYHVKCSREDISALSHSAKQLEDRLRAARESNRTLDSDRIVMITALNIMHELFTVTQQKTQYTQLVNQKLRHLQAKVDDAMAHSLQEEFASDET